MIYLASPYTHPSLEQRNWRYQRAKAALFGLWEQGEPALCPIVMGHEYEQRQRTPVKSMPHDFWMRMARTQLVACTKLWLLTLPGWRDSDGVGQEVILAAGMNKPVVGYAPIAECEEVSGADIMKEFGVWKKTMN